MNDKPPIAEAKTKPTASATAAAKPDPNLSILIGGPPEQSQIPIAHNTQVTGIAQQFVALDSVPVSNQRAGFFWLTQITHVRELHESLRKAPCFVMLRASSWIVWSRWCVGVISSRMRALVDQPNSTERCYQLNSERQYAQSKSSLCCITSLCYPSHLPITRDRKTTRLHPSVPASRKRSSRDPRRSPD